MNQVPTGRTVTEGVAATRKDADDASSLLSSSLSLRTSDRAPWIHRLPREMMQRIFFEVIERDGNNLRWMAEFSCVCRRWYDICLDPVMWEFVAKRCFVVYPLILRLEHSAPLDTSSQEVMRAVRRLGVGGDGGDGNRPFDPVSPLRPPTRGVLRQAVEVVRHHRARQQYYKYVQRRRSFVLHLFLSAMLLSLTVAITAAMCAAEGVPIPLLCTKEASFTFLWICYLCIVAIIVSNVVMQAHFEPQPLLLRLRRNKLLILASAAVIVLGVIDVMVPTALIEVNLNRTERFSWLWCGTTVILSFCAWQCYALLCIMPDARAHLQHQLTSLNVKEGLQFVMMNVPNAFPLLFAAALFCALQYVQRGSRLYVFLGGVPVVVSLGVLALVFLLDYLSLRRSKDLSVALCLFTAMFFPLSLLWFDFRGWCLIPLAASVLGFFLSHARFVVRRALHKLRETERAAAAAAAASAAPNRSDGANSTLLRGRQTLSLSGQRSEARHLSEDAATMGHQRQRSESTNDSRESRLANASSPLADEDAGTACAL